MPVTTWRALVVERLGRELDTKGTLKVLRRGFRFYGKTFRVASFRPANDLNREMVELFERNELSVTRQVPMPSGQARDGGPGVRVERYPGGDM